MDLDLEDNFWHRRRTGRAKTKVGETSVQLEAQRVCDSRQECRKIFSDLARRPHAQERPRKGS